MNSPLQEMKMWPQEVNPLWFCRAVEERSTNMLQSHVQLNASASFVWVIVVGAFPEGVRTCINWLSWRDTAKCVRGGGVESHLMRE